MAQLLDSVNPEEDLQLAHSTHIALGIFLTVSSIIGICANTIVLITFWRSVTSRLSPSSIVLINLTLSDIGILIMGFPFNATSHLAGRWLFGEIGCQMYGFCCFLFGTAHIGALSLLAYEQHRTISKMRPDAAPSQSYLDRIQRTYIFYGAFIWMFACMCSTPPLLGWGRYSKEPFGTACTIDWRQNNFEYKTYIATYFVGGYVLPFSLVLVSFRRTVLTRRIYRVEIARRSSGTQSQPTIIDSIKQQREEDLTTTCMLIVVSFLMTWTPYAVLCLWSAILGPETVPTPLMVVPNIFAKASGAVNPFIYSISNRNLRSGIIDTLRAVKSSLCGARGRSENEQGDAKLADENVGLSVLNAPHPGDCPL